jgi:hypothetical protein
VTRSASRPFNSSPPQGHTRDTSALAADADAETTVTLDTGFALLTPSLLAIYTDRSRLSVLTPLTAAFTGYPRQAPPGGRWVKLSDHRMLGSFHNQWSNSIKRSVSVAPKPSTAKFYSASALRSAACASVG